MFAKRLNAIAFRCMMTGGQIAEAQFARLMRGLLGEFSGQKGIDAEAGGLLEITLAAARAPGQARDETCLAPDPQRWARESLRDMLGEGRRGQRLSQATDPDQTIAQRSRRHVDETEPLTELDVVTEFGMGIERKMIGDQTRARPEQCPCAPPFDANQTGGFVLPEPAVVDQDGIGPLGDRRLDQRRAGRDTGDQTSDRTLSLDLQAVRGIVSEARRLEQVFAITDEVLCFGHGGHYRIGAIGLMGIL
jgi:hypothetical protein